MATYYVSNTGLDTNNGTASATPWQTVAKVNSTALNPGDAVLFQRGGIWREQLTISNSGTSGNPITLDAYGTGFRPQISGTDILSGWTLYSGNVYRSSYTASISVYLLIEDASIATLVSNLASLTAPGQFWYDNVNHLVYYWTTVSDSPANHLMEIGNRTHNISIANQSYVTINNLQLHGAGGQFGNSIYGIPSSAVMNGITVNNCEIDHAYYRGIFFQYFGTLSGDGYTLSNNIIHHNGQLGIYMNGVEHGDTVYPANYTDNTRFTNVTITGNHIHHNGSLAFPSTVLCGGVNIRNVKAPIITYNEIDNNMGTINISGGLYCSSCPYSVVKYNFAHDNRNDNFHWDVNSNNATVAFNISANAYHNGFMFEEHYASDGPSYVLNNLSYGDISSMYLGPGGVIYAVSGLYVYNNIFTNPSTRCVGIDVNKSGASLSSYQPNYFDYNIYYAPGKNLFQTTNYPSGNTTYSTISAWNSLMGFGDIHSQNVNPGLADYQGTSGKGNYRPAKGSPAIASGTSASIYPSIYPTTDYAGVSFPLNGYDIGPYAYGARYGGV